MKKISLKGLSHEDWLNLRTQGIGGSDAGAICRVNPYKSAADVFLDKTSQALTNQTDSEAMRQGRDLEEYVAQRFMEATGYKVKRSGYLYQSEKHSFMLANIDRLIVGEKAGLECKTCSAYSGDQWSNGKIPESYQIQCQHYMAVMDWDFMYIACIILGKGFLYQRIERDESLIRGLTAIEQDFWENHVLTGKMPEPDGSKAYDDILNRYFRTSIRNNSAIPLIGFEQDLERRENLMELAEKIDRECAEIDQRLKLYLGEHETAANQNYRISWTSVTTNRFDSKRFKAEQEELYKAYTKETTSRRFCVKRIHQDVLASAASAAA